MENMSEQEKKDFNYFQSKLGNDLTEVELKEKYFFWKKHIYNNKSNELEIVNNFGGRFKVFSLDFMKFADKKIEWQNDIVNYLYSLQKDPRKLTIFKVDDSFKEKTNKKFSDFMFPFDNIYVDSLITYDDGKEIFSAQGFIIKKNKNEDYEVNYLLSKSILDRHYTISFSIIDLELLDNIDENYFSEEQRVEYIKKGIYEPEKKMMIIIKNVLKNLLDKIIKKQYREYYKIENNKYVKKEIVYPSKKSYCMHFWKDSGKYINIYKMNDEQLIVNGYGIDGWVLRGNELRCNVPYKKIDEQNKEKRKINKIIDLRKKRIWRQEEKIYRILKEIYPNKIIRRHDRKTLKGLELDFNIPELRLGIEYDGEQHFDKELYKKLYGEGFEAQIKRDNLKNKLCKKKNIKLVRIKYDEKLSKRLIVKKIKEVLNGKVY